MTRRQRRQLKYDQQRAAALESSAKCVSTGPRSDEGKAVSSRNAVKHNLCSAKLIGSDLEELNDIRAKLDDEWEPQTETERMLLAQMALGQWRMDRALSLELQVFDQPEFDQRALALALRYRTSAERSFYKALSELQKLRAAIREGARRALKDEEEEAERELKRQLDRLCFAPIRTPPPVPEFVSQQFVSQNPVPPVANPPRHLAERN
jgi:hypothetical protein